jgi:heme/copper-type cytochrome/quinol oxidase subunit 4
MFHGETRVFMAIMLFSLPAVAFGGFSLLRLLIGRGLSEFQISYFRAGHAHAGVLLVLGLVVLDVIDRTSGSAQVIFVGALLVVGILAQSGGMFLHMAVGQPGRWSIGNVVTTVGAVALAVALVTAGVEVVTYR